jgi:predicted nucleic acid-binding protein
MENGQPTGSFRLELIGRLYRLTDALIAATGVQYGVPIVTGDRRLARALGTQGFWVPEHGP